MVRFCYCKIRLAFTEVEHRKCTKNDKDLFPDWSLPPLLLRYFVTSSPLQNSKTQGLHNFYSLLILLCPSGITINSVNKTVREQASEILSDERSEEFIERSLFEKVFSC